VKHGEGNTNSPKLSLLKFLPLAYHHSHFLTATLDFTSFFTAAFLGATHNFYSWAAFELDYYQFSQNDWVVQKDTPANILPYTWKNHEHMLG